MTRSTSRRPSRPPFDSSSPRNKSADGSLLRWGFKAAADRQAGEIRATLGLADHDRLDPVHLAAHLGITLVPLSHLERANLSKEALRHLLRTKPAACSAAYIRRPGSVPHIP